MRITKQTLAIYADARKEREQPTEPDYSGISPFLLKQARKDWKAGDIEGVLSKMGNHEHFRFVTDNLARLVARGLYERAFLTAYTSINLNAGSLPHWDDLRWLLGFADRRRLLAISDPLPDNAPFTVYRGVGDGRIKKYARGLSWTASPEVASWFAVYWGGRVKNSDPAVFEYTVKISDEVIFYLNERNEQEFVIDLPPQARPRRLAKLPNPAKLPDDPFDDVYYHARNVFKCDPTSVHGAQHWRNVESNGMQFCKRTGADLTVVRCFALLHDCCRKDDGADPKHGVRSADRLSEFAKQLAVLKGLDRDQMRLLDYAIRHHVAGKVSDDPTIGTCWDADRLELDRVGIVADERYMSTAMGKLNARRLAGKG